MPDYRKGAKNVVECKIYHNNQSYVKQLELNLRDSLIKLDDEFKKKSLNIVIQWGKKIEKNNYDNTDYICNTNEAISNVSDRLRMFRILKINGIDIPNIIKTGITKLGKPQYQMEQVKAIRNYRVFVFQFQTLVIYRSNDDLVWLSTDMSKVNHKYYEVSESENFETKRIALLAQRTIYSLGLDFGSVLIGVTSNKKRVVLDVEHTPKLNIKREKLYREAIIRFIKQYAKDMDTTEPIIGADPEFMFKDKQGKMVLASKYFSKNGKVGCDARTINRNKAKRPLAEIRPDPSGNPDKVIESIKNIIDEAVAHINLPSIEWIAGSMPFKGYSIGGHVHFSNVKLNSPIARALDNYLAVPIALIEDPVTARKRRLKYGFLGDVRSQFHGGFEYRTLGSWVLSPQISKAVLHLSQFIVKNYTVLKANNFQSFTNQKKFYSMNREQLKKYYIDIWKQLEATPNFVSIQKKVNIIPEMISKEQIWEESNDFKINWRSKTYKISNKRAKSS